MDFGVIGYGYWGPNVVRNLMSLEESRVVAIAEISPAARARALKAYPGSESDRGCDGSHHVGRDRTPLQSFLRSGRITN